MAIAVLVIATGALVVWNFLWLARLRRSTVATPGHKRHIWGQQFIGLMVLAAVLLEAPFGAAVRDIVASACGVIGIALLFSTNR